MSHLDNPRFGFRMIAILPILLFIPSLVSFVISEPGVVWPEYSGVFFHLAILLLISKLDAPTWAKAAGYNWIALDVLTGIMSINGVAHDITWPIRLGGHVFAGVWIAVASACMSRQLIRIIGVVTGIWLGGYSFVADVAPDFVLYPSALLIVVWFALLAAMHEQTSASDDSAQSPHRNDSWPKWIVTVS